MLSSSPDEIVEAFGALRDAVSRVCELSFDALTTPERLNFLERLEIEARRSAVPRHELMNQIVEQSNSEELGGKLPAVLAERLRITRGDARRRVAEAADLGPRRALTGEPLPALLTATAEAQRAGLIGAAHVRVKRSFLRRMPVSVDIGTREAAEAHLAELATRFDPETLVGLADVLSGYLNSDGEYTDEDCARRRGLTLGKQDIDGMSRLSGWLTPEARASLEAVSAKLAAPGICNPGSD